MEKREPLRQMVIRVTSRQAEQLARLRQEEDYCIAPLIRRFIQEGLARMGKR